MQALEVSHFRGITSLDQRVEARLDQFNGAAAQHGLLAKQVGLGLFTEVRFDHTGAAAADRASIRERDIAGGAGRVLMHGNQRGNAATLGIRATHRMAGGLRGDHHDIDIVARHDLAIVNVEAVGKRERRARLDVVVHAFAIDLGDVLVGQKHHDEIGRLDGLFNRRDLQAGVDRLLPGSAARAQADDDLDAGLMQVKRMGMTLRAIADDGNGLALDQ